ncbi:glycerol uptake facilitator protein-like protein [Cladochytrium replicatum]|nr:glycerol uptake facilitator protein-like protein [Cladochytrium replicatum]
MNDKTLLDMNSEIDRAAASEVSYDRLDGPTPSPDTDDVRPSSRPRRQRPRTHWALSMITRRLAFFVTKRNPLFRAFFGEVIGTFLLVWWGLSSVSTAVIGGALSGLWQLASTWGFGVAIAIYIAAPFSGAHLNPAFSIANAVLYPDFGWMRCGVYIVAQFIGALAAGFLNLALWNPAIVRFEASNNIVRGTPESIRSAMIFGEYFPNPEVFKPHEGELFSQTRALMSPVGAVFIEALGTAIIGFVVTALSDSPSSIVRGFEPFMIEPQLSGSLSPLLATPQAPLSAASNPS